MIKEKLFNNQKLKCFFGNENDINKYPILNKIIAIYVAVTLIFQVSAIIAPVLTFLSQTPLYHFKSYFGIIGALLIVIDIFTNKVIWRGAYCYLWYGIIFIAVISSIRTISYGVSDNLFTICWIVIEITLFYTLSYRLSKEDFKNFIFILTSILVFIWFIACFVSISQFAKNIRYSYLGDLISEDKTKFIQGFAKNRLYGIFNPINHAAYISLMLSTVSVYYISQSKKLYIKIPYIIATIFLLLHIILSNSRSGLVAIFAEIFVWFFLYIRNKIKIMNIKKFLICSVCACLAVVIAVFGHTVVKDLSELIPKVYSVITSDNSSNKDTSSEKDNTSKEDTSKEDNFKNALDRNIGSDTSNSRFQIWSDYISCYDDIGLIGLSPGNYMPYMRENHSDLYIVEYIKKYNPEKYNAGIVYHVHNGYLMVYVATGLLGFIILLIFIVLCLKRVLQYLFTIDFIKPEIILLLLVSLAGAIAAMFDRGIFLSDNPQTFMFWIALGTLMKLTHNPTSNKEKNYDN